ncbi:MAG: flippase [Thermodesulfobacteriota bacterium]
MSTTNHGGDSSAPEGILTLAKGTTLSFLGEAGHIAITYIYGVIVARFLGTRDFGVFFLGITIFNLATLCSYCGIEDGLMRFLGRYVQSKEIPKAKGVIRFSLMLSLSLGILCGAFCFFLADFFAGKVFNEPNLSNVLRYLSLGIPIFSFLTVSVASIRGFKVLAPYVLIRKIFLPIISFTLAIGALTMGYGLHGLTISYVISMGASAVLAAFLLMSFLSRFNEEGSSTYDLGSYVSFISATFLVNILLFLFNWSDMIILGIFRSSQEIGIYFASKRTALVLSLLLISLNAIFAPVIAHLYSGNKITQLNRAYKASTQWMLMFSLPLFLIMVFFAEELLSLFGPAFGDGRMCLIVLAVGQLVNASFGSNGYLLMMTGHHRWMVFNAIIFVILTIPLTLILVPRYGMLGAAYANGTGIAFANLVGMAEVYLVLRLHPYSIYYFKILLMGAITAVITCIVRYYFPTDGSIVFLLAGSACVFSLFFVLVILLGLDENERLVLTAIKERLMPS